MTKAELVVCVAEKAKIDKNTAEKAIKAVFDTIKKALSEDDKVQLIGFGTFENHKRAARKGRNPRTGAEIDIPASKLPAFKAGKGLKEAVNK